mmetsp:Transcript_430/g.631  ORF Transcript_430/g.631 Transcript_430/m.631 type:complete len:210 (+) Transcript_430:426-1055(+)
MSDWKSADPSICAACATILSVLVDFPSSSRTSQSLPAELTLDLISASSSSSPSIIFSPELSSFCNCGVSIWSCKVSMGSINTWGLWVGAEGMWNSGSGATCDSSSATEFSSSDAREVTSSTSTFSITLSSTDTALLLLLFSSRSTGFETTSTSSFCFSAVSTGTATGTGSDLGSDLEFSLFSFSVIFCSNSKDLLIASVKAASQNPVAT